ncbi:MAG: hypothetical protein HKN45_10235 [Flavobacteriales bacterium]|nr:hypothetical protein [Flavobacteriales bacterium]
MRTISFVLTLTVLLISSCCFAQSDTLGRYSPGFKFKDGIYLVFDDFKSNCTAIPLKDLRDREGNEVSQIDEDQELYYLENDTLRPIDTDVIFGFSDQGKVSLGYEGNFNRLVVIGTLCHVVQREIVVDYIRGGLYEFNSMPVRREVQKEFILDMRTGEMSAFNPSNLDYHIADDSIIASGYTKQSQKKRRALLYSTLHSYNRAHPMYFPISRCKR